jgi:hypothetical protein
MLPGSGGWGWGWACRLVQGGVDEIAVVVVGYDGDGPGPFVEYEPGFVKAPQALLPEGSLQVFFGQAADP